MRGVKPYGCSRSPSLSASLCPAFCAGQGALHGTAREWDFLCWQWVLVLQMGDLGLVLGSPPNHTISVPLHGWGIAPFPAHAAAVGILHQQQHDRAMGPVSY